ncbi:T9SS type A sorting domain-containing protein [Empedobacter stercoris]|uniref:type IX secretion system anionic LPS delivery protein PorZ n=1 Tax=Empedobacter stercoris TaxID=1628248 RepID=UPI001CE1C5BA|nr:two-component regulator propeller domain-containing protein [Empedobacter stercoris]MCA4781156.1 T9SS type A sorting domain-containing protein [Empedobacter stercoris]
MKTKLFIFITMIFTSLNAQNDKARWNDLFSYSNVKLLEEVNGVIYCGTENGIFLFNPKNPTNDWIKLNKTNFLNNVGVSAMAYDKESDSFLVGYENGGLDLLRSGESTMVLDIKWNGFSGDKKVNHILINDGIAFISGAFGIVSYDLKDEEFKETTRTNSAKIDDVTILNIVVNDATILNNKLYIATSKGIFSSELTSKKLNNPNINLWTVQNLNQNVSNIELFEKEIYYSVENELKTISGTPVSEAFNFIEDLKLSNEKLIITQNNQISVLGSGDYSKSEINFNTAISIDNIVYGGSVNHGIINLSNLEEFYPDGPFNNKAWSVTTKNGKVWIAPGGTEGYTAPIQNEDGFSMYNGKKWNHFSSECLGTARDITTVSVNPTNDKNFVIGSFNKVDNNTRLFEFNTDFSTNLSNCRDEYKLILNTEIPGSRISGVKFDALGDLYIGASFPSNFSQDWKVTFYAKRTNNSWITYGPESGNESVALSPSVTDSYVYYPVARNGGIIVFDKNLGKVQSINTSNSKLPINNVLAIANDKTNNLWIGTGQGLVVLYSADDSVKNNTVNVEPIVIIQDGIPEALLTDVGIYSIKVDNANRKWIATNGAGVYYVSESGEETKLHFTSKNSPLPSDIVYDVSIDETTGKVFFATEKGVVSYNGDVSTETNNFNDAIAYPNPYRPEYTGNITIKNLPNRALVKITDIVGNLLFEKKADGGVIEWNTNNSKGKPVASGIYLVLMTNADGTETKTLKLAVVR